MKTVGDLILLAAQKAGIDPTDESLKAVNENKTLFTIAVDDNVFSKIDAELISFEKAKSHPLIATEITSKAKREVLDGIDGGVFKNILTDLAISDDEVSDIMKEKNTFKKIELLTKKVAEISAAKSKASTTGDKAEFTKQIEALNQEIVKQRAELESKLQAEKGNYDSKIFDFALTSNLASKNFVLKDVEKSVNLQVSKQTLANELQAKGARAVYDEATNTIKLVNAANPEIAYYENNKEVNFDTFADRVLLEKKLISPHGQPPAPAPARGGNQQPPQPPPAGMSALQEKMKQRAEQFK